MVKRGSSARQGTQRKSIGSNVADVSARKMSSCADEEARRVSKPKKELTVERLREVLPLITNKTRRQQYAQKLQSLVKKNKTKERRARREAESRGEVIERQVPNTIERLRREDVTIVKDNDTEIADADAVDEFSDYMQGKVQPKLLMTTSKNPSKKLLDFIKELQIIIPNVFYFARKDYRIQSIVEYAQNASYTDVLVLAERLNKPCGLYICHLPAGPTSFFKLSSVKLAQEMPNTGATTTHTPEVILNNFVTRLGRRVGRQLMALFPQAPEFAGRRAICFHNQRDFIFFRHHRYIFNKGGKSCRLQEIGPRFTMKLRWLQKGVFDTVNGLMEYEWRPDSQVDRKRMYL